MDQDQLDAIRYIRLAANRCEGDLTAPEFEERPGPTVKTVCRRLDSSWNKAKSLAGIKPAKKRGMSKEDLCEDLHRVARELGETPTYEQYNERGKYSTGPFRHRLGDGTWNDGLRACGLEPRKRYDLTAETAVAELQNIADSIQHTPSSNEFDELSQHRHGTIISKLNVDSWREACRKADLKPNSYPQENSSKELANVSKVAELYESGMTTQELAERYNCNPNSISYRLKRFGIELREPGLTSVFCELLGSWVGSKTERDFAKGLNEAGLLDKAEYHPEPVERGAHRWEPDFKVREWLVECKQGTWGEYTQAPVMEVCDDPILVYGLEEDIKALPHDKSIVRVPGEVPDLEHVFRVV